jgi:hypothetical protein
MSAGDQMRAFVKVVETRQRDVFTGMVDEAHRSIQEGSEITGAPGQPVGQTRKEHGTIHLGGTLKASWQRWFPSPTSAMIATNVIYAPAIEHGVGHWGGLTLRSSVGGFHSVALTVAAWQRIADYVVERVRGGA